MKKNSINIYAGILFLGIGSGLLARDATTQTKDVTRAEQQNHKKDNSQVDTSRGIESTTEQVSPKNRSDERYIIDDILVVIYTQEGSEFITASEVQRPNLDGSPRTLDEIILERLLYLDAKKYKMEPDSDAIDKHLATVQKQNNLTRDEMLEVFKSAGYDYEQGRRQLGMMFAINSIIEFKVTSRLIVPERDVKAYYEAHPITLEPTYKLQRALIPYSTTKSSQELKKKLTEILSGAGSLTISWSESFWIDQSQLAEDKQGISSMSVGAISDPQEKADGFEIFKLVDKKPERQMPLEERYREIVDTLRQPKFKELMAEYKKKLYDEASIVYMHPERDVHNTVGKTKSAS